MIRNSLLWLSEQQQIFNFVRRNGAREAVRVALRGRRDDPGGGGRCGALEVKGIHASLDLLGESVTAGIGGRGGAVSSTSQMVDDMAAAHDQVNVSVKLTQMGFDIDEDLCHRNMTKILEHAEQHDGFVRLDMESSAYTQRTLDFFSQPALPALRQALWCRDPVMPAALRHATSSASST